MGVPDSYTKSLLHMDGADASTTFTDESGKTWTIGNGTPEIDTAQSVFGGASCYFNGSNNERIVSADHADWWLDDGNNANKWTVDFRVRFDGDPGTGSIGFIQQYVDTSNYWAIRLSSNLLIFTVRSDGTNIVNITQAWNPADATWYHVATVKDGTNGYMHFVDGVQLGSTTTDTSPIPDFADELKMALYIDSTNTYNYFTGWIDEFRISKGVARWISNFKLPKHAYDQFPKIKTINGIHMTDIKTINGTSVDSLGTLQGLT